MYEICMISIFRRLSLWNCLNKFFVYGGQPGILHEAEGGRDSGFWAKEGEGPGLSSH